MVWGLFEAILESIELGEEDWGSDFQHYENMVHYNRSDKGTILEKEKRKSDKLEVFWCKAFQKDSPHIAVVKPEEPLSLCCIAMLCAYSEMENMQMIQKQNVQQKSSMVLGGGGRHQ